MKKIAIMCSVVMLLGATSIVLNLAPEATITVEAFSPQEIHDLGWESAPSNGLKVVGIGELVYVSGAEASGEEVTSFTWTLQPPTGSTATMDSVGTRMNTFRPDMAGTFIVELSTNSASGTAATSVAIVAAEYVGVGTVGGQTPDAGAGQCAACHSGTESDWSQTGHSDFFEIAIDGLKSDHYNSDCISCHTVGYNTDEAAVNGGFDDVATALGWTFPATLEAGNWDNIVTNFPALATVSNIQCESCHGPGSLHKGDKTKTDISLDTGMCARCHDEEPYHRRPAQWANSSHATGTSFARGTSTSCAPCHSGWGFIALVDPASDLDQKTGDQNVSCAVCHDPHSAHNEYQVRKVDAVELTNGDVVTGRGSGQLCMNCHKSRRDAEDYVKEYHSHYGPHHSNQTDMLMGTNSITFGRYIPSSTHRDALDDTCVSCHMFATPGDGEPGHDEIGDHTFAMYTVDEDGNRTDNVAACTSCHGSMESFNDIMAREDYDGDGEVESAQEEVSGMLDNVGMLLPPVGDPSVDVTPDFTPLQLKTAYNYFYVTDDGSHGMHNFQYTINLLQLTHDVLTYGVLTEGSITQITDVPNDQGRQVQVEWTRFGGDGASDEPVEMYYVWRRVDNASMAKVSEDVKIYESVKDVPADPEELGDALLSMDNMLWTAVASQPASQMELYSAVAPTLYDSTALDGAHWSVFSVSGHTSTSTIYVVSAPDSAYSIDNLIPGAPTALAAVAQDGNIELTWTQSMDPDVDYYAVYRGTGGFFNPNAPAIAEVAGSEVVWVDTDVETGKTYSYKMRAFDFSGNESRYSGVADAAVGTGVGSEEGIPTEFALNQNYPNPFNPSTLIQFAVPEAGNVRISVYDIAGREVAILVNQPMQPGRFTITWDAGNRSSGVYFYKMESENFVTTKTMMLLK